MSAQAQNPFEIAKRAQKVARLVEQIDHELVARGWDPHRDAARVVTTLRGWTDARWAEIAVLAAVCPPSAVSRARVVSTYERRACS